MTLDDYLRHRRRFEIGVALAVVGLITTTGATTEIIDNYRAGLDPDWRGAWAKEITSGIVVLLLLPLVELFLRWLNLTWENLRWRVLWHLPGFLVFSILHIGLFTLFRELVWASAGEQYDMGPVGLSLLYEMRKDLVTYLAIVGMLEAYRFILTRLRGEARFLSASESALEQTPAAYRSQFLVKMLDKEYLVKVNQIDWIGSASNYVLMHCGGRTYPMRSTLSGLAEQLDPGQFMRVHRTAIINLSSIRMLQERGDLAVELISGERVPISKTHLNTLKEALNG